MDYSQIATVIASVIANGVLLIAFRVNLEHRLTRLETHMELMMKGEQP